MYVKGNRKRSASFDVRGSVGEKRIQQKQCGVVLVLVVGVSSFSGFARAPFSLDAFLCDDEIVRNSSNNKKHQHPTKQ